MKAIPRLALLLALAAQLPAAAPRFSDVFVSGQDGYKSVRIPSVVVTKGGAVLAFAEGRQRPSDQAENDIVLKRSTDGGVTWGALQLIHDDGANSLNNPTSLVADTGRVFLMYQRIPGHLREASKETATGFEGENIYRNLLVWSDDEGVTWSKPLDVTRTTKRPAGATTICSGPGLGIQLTRGPHQGRLIFPFNEGPFWKWQNFAVLSDDGGKTWRCGENVPGALLPDAKQGMRSLVNEVQMVELSDGSVRLNSRQFAGAKVRKTAVSKDGGVTWSPVEDAPALRDPSCMAAIFRYSFGDGAGKGRLLYSGPDSTKRENGTVRLSLDDGVTWPVARVLVPGGFAYSVLTRLADGTIGCLYEADNYGRIAFARFDLAWLEQPAKPAAGEAKAAFKSSAATESDPRLHADGQGWRLDQATRTDPKRPRVLLMGDSILNGYLPGTVKALEGQAYVDAWVNPLAQSSFRLHEMLAEVLANGPYDIVHVNMGLHGWQKGRIPDGQFEPLTRKLVETIRAKAPGATFIWASSTPVTTKDKPGELSAEINPIIVEHNRMAAKVMAEAKVPVNDLYAVVASHLELARGDQFHWKPEGTALLKDAVVATLQRELKARAGK